MFEGLMNNLYYTAKRIAGTHVYYSLDYLIYFVPFLLFVFKSRQEKLFLKNYIPVVAFILILFEGAIVSTWLLYDYFEQAWQPQYYTLCLGSIVLIFWFYLWSEKLKDAYSKAVLIVIIVISVFNIQNTLRNNKIINDERFAKYDVSKDFFVRANELFSSSKDATVGFWESNPDKPTVYPIGNILMHINSQISLECIDPSLISDKNNKAQYNVTSMSEFHNKFEYPINIDSITAKFVDLYEIKYILGYDVPPENSILNERSKVVLKDSISNLSIREFFAGTNNNDF
ncbi:hypothetical protein [Reichenbachiella sp.]|uniref:hypothetical protein n=1 Tax=Reichenbachiella sp. TaxID=2184521 RepID=UPI003B5C5DAE